MDETARLQSRTTIETKSQSGAILTGQLRDDNCGSTKPRFSSSWIESKPRRQQISANGNNCCWKPCASTNIDWVAQVSRMTFKWACSDWMSRVDHSPLGRIRRNDIETKGEFHREKTSRTRFARREIHQGTRSIDANWTSTGSDAHRYGNGADSR